jgi:hypothetical protein
MKSTMRPVFAAAAVLALTVPVVISGPAQAGAYRSVGERTLANSSLSVADVPRWMRHGSAPRMQSKFEEGRSAVRPDLCPSNEVGSPSVLGKRPQQSMQSVAITRGGSETLRGTLVESAIFQYRSRADAERAWAFLNAQAQTCPSFVIEEVDPFRFRQEVNTRVRALPNLFGTVGLEVSSDVSADVEGFDLAVLGDVYAHYYLAGTSIVRVQFTNVNGDSRGVGRVTQGFVQTMAIVIAQRVERHSSR